MSCARFISYKVETNCIAALTLTVTLSVVVQQERLPTCFKICLDVLLMLLSKVWEVENFRDFNFGQIFTNNILPQTATTGQPTTFKFGNIFIENFLALAAPTGPSIICEKKPFIWTILLYSICLCYKCNIRQELRRPVKQLPVLQTSSNLSYLAKV